MVNRKKNFGEKLKAARLAADLTQQQASERAGFGQPTWADYESGRRNPGIEMLQKLAAAVGATVSDLIS